MIIAFLIKLIKAEREFSELIQCEHEKTLAGIERYNAMKNQPK